MYFFKEIGKQVLDLTGNLILSFNDSLVKCRAPSAAPDAIKNRKSIMINELGTYRKIKATFIVIGFIWGKDQQLKPGDTALNKPYVKDIPKDYDTETEGRESCPVINKHCEFYSYQCDNNGEVAIDYCIHPKNQTDTEGNAIRELCPLLELNIVKHGMYHCDDHGGFSFKSDCIECNNCPR